MTAFRDMTSSQQARLLNSVVRQLQVFQLMKKYKTFVRGENFLINIDGREQRLGFYTTVFVEANDQEEAEQRSIQLLRDDPKLQESTLNNKSDSPMMFVEEIEELDTLDGHKLPRIGFSFFPMENGGKSP